MLRASAKALSTVASACPEAFKDAVAALPDASSAWLAASPVADAPLMFRNAPFVVTAPSTLESVTGSGSATGLWMLTSGLSNVGRSGACAGVCVPAIRAWICGGAGGGESCQSKKRVMSSFSAAFARPRTASPKTPPVGTATVSTVTRERSTFWLVHVVHSSSSSYVNRYTR